jgi:hypothetical protein
MEDRDLFALWIAAAVLRGNDDEFTAEALASLAAEANAPGELDALLTAAAANAKRPGDIGLDFVAPLLSLVLVEFGRALWDSYIKSLADQGGKALANVTLAGLKQAVRRAWGGESATLSLDDIEGKLRLVSAQAGLSSDKAEEIVVSLRRAATVEALKSNRSAE